MVNDKSMCMRHMAKIKHTSISYVKKSYAKISRSMVFAWWLQPSSQLEQLEPEVLDSILIVAANFHFPLIYLPTPNVPPCLL